MRADILLNNQQVTTQNEAQTLCQWELGTYQADHIVSSTLATLIGATHE
tara:strand:- start:57695 stop:57841 length:147 start_codon:yes stop_codon:yes gene_type:complete